MKNIATLVNQTKRNTSKWNFSCERQELVQKFVDRLNLGRKGTKYKPLDAKRVNSMVGISHMTTWELHGFYKECEGANHFGKFFFWSLKPK